MSAKLFKEWQEMAKILLGHKYWYYMENTQTISDYEYDVLEKKWEDLGRRIGKTRTPPFWVGFDFRHPFAAEVADKIRGHKE